MKWDKHYDDAEYTWTAWLRDEEEGNTIAVLSQSVRVDTPNSYYLKVLGLEKSFEAGGVSEAVSIAEDKIKSILGKYASCF